MTDALQAASNPLINYQWVLRDAIQSLFGTNPSAEEILDVARHGHLTGVKSIQIAGGTFYDIFARKGRDEWAELEILTGYFRETDEYKSGELKLSALIRGDFLFGYDPQPYDVVKSMVREHAKLGVNVLQNFHGMNDARCLVGVAQAVRELREEEGLDIHAQGVICVEENENITIESCMAFAEELVEMGHEGFYLKSASGYVDPEFIGKLTAALYDKYPDQDINVHIHSTYGKAAASYMRASQEAVKRGKEIMLDGQVPAFAGLTSHPSIFKLQDQLLNSGDELLVDNCPVLNADMVKADEEAQYKMRYQYHEFESPYDLELLEAMKRARAPGGASSTLKSIDGLVGNLEVVLGTQDWRTIQLAVYNMQAEILPDLGDPTQVTPFAANTTGQAAFCVYNELIAVSNFEQAIKTILGSSTDSMDAKKTKLLQLASDTFGAEVFESMMPVLVRSILDEKCLNTVDDALRSFKKLENWDDIIQDFKKVHRYDNLHEGAANYLVGRHGTVPEKVDKDLQAKALGKFGLEKPVDYIVSTDLDNVLEGVRETVVAEQHEVAQLSSSSAKDAWMDSTVKESVIPNPTDRQLLSARLIDDGLDHVVKCATGKNKPQQPPVLPFWAKEPEQTTEGISDVDGKPVARDIRDALKALGGISALEKLAERVSHLRQIDDGYCQFALDGETDLGKEWYDKNLTKVLDFMDSIEDRLKAAGFVRRGMDTALLGFNAFNVPQCIRDVIETKGAGSNDYIDSKLREHRLAAMPQPSGPTARTDTPASLQTP